MPYNSADYTALLLDHFEHPRNVGELEAPEATALVENPACGDSLRLSLRIRDGVVTEARFRSQGCPAAIAAGSVTTELLAGRGLDEAWRLTNAEVARALGGLPPAKAHCSVLAEQAVRSAIASYREGRVTGSAQRGDRGLSSKR